MLQGYWDFQVEDVWALQTPGGPDELPRLVSSMVSDSSDNSSQGAPLIVRFLWAAEMVDRTVHIVMHVGWVPDQCGGYRGQMAVLVKPNGLFGAASMAAIKPLRYLFVYPALMRSIEPGWRAGYGNSATRKAAGCCGSCAATPARW